MLPSPACSDAIVSPILGVKSPRLLVICGIALVGACSSVRAGDVFKFDQTDSTIAFKVRHFLGNAKGRFTKFNGIFEVDRAQLEKSSVNATIQAASIDTAIAKRDQHLRSSEFFNVTKYPEITFRSKSVKQTGSDTGDIAGELTMHGMKQQITLHVKFLGPEGATTAQTTKWQVTAEPINRRDFGLAFSDTVERVSMISDKVIATMEIEAKR